MRRQIADRLLLTTVSLTVVVISQVEPQSLSYVMVKSGGIPALFCMGFLAVTSTLALIDTIVNDMLPATGTLRLAFWVPCRKPGGSLGLQRVSLPAKTFRLRFETGLGRRRGLWMAIAITYAGIAFVAQKGDFGWSVSLFYILFALRSAGISFLDLYYEYADFVKDPSTPISDSIAGVLGDD